MQPYSTPFYFVMLGIPLIPLVIAHSYGKKWMPYQVILSLVFLWVTFGGSVTLYALIGFGVFETLLLKLYSLYRQKQNKTWVFYIVTLLSIVPLISVKVTPVLNSQHPESILGFLGISYLTFRVVNVLIETRDGLIKELPIKDLLYFVYFFPTISSGPIDRFRRFQKELHEPITDKYYDYVKKGLFYIFQGFLYKFIIGYLIDNHWLHDVAIEAVRHPSFLNVASSMYAYGLYLFFDFAGYSLFAVGVALIMGYDIPRNFNKPFLSKNIQDFWQRWHMSLSFWFRDFVFMRLVKWIMVKRWSKNMVRMANIGYLADFLLMGFWHGLTWFYIVYGLYHAGMMIGYEAWLRLKKRKKWKIPDNKLTSCISILITLNLVFISFLIFSGIPDLIIRHAMGIHVAMPNF